MRVKVAGVAMSQFGELWTQSLSDLSTTVITDSLLDAGITARDIDAVFVGNMLSGILENQEHLGPIISHILGTNVPAFHIEGACASGGLAIHTGINSLLAKKYQTVLVLGVEKMTDVSSEQISQALMSAASETERNSGITFPGLYALITRSHIEKFGTTPDQLANVSVKNHYYASLNPKAQFHNILTVDQVLSSPLVADPLRLLECSPITDGAAAIILTTKNVPGSVEIIASSVATDSVDLCSRKNLYFFQSTKIAATKAYQEAKVNPDDISVAEVHDCFTIAQIVALQDLDLSSLSAINTSGGLKGCGHPVGATGVKQLVELTYQLRGTAGNRQIQKANFGLAHNIGGTGATAVIHILKSYD